MRTHDLERDGLVVVPRPGETPDRMIRRFVKKVRNDGVLQEFYIRSFFEKPSVRRRRKAGRARAAKRAQER